MKTTINQQEYEFEIRPGETAVEVIRERADLTGTKFVCGAGVCGACTVLVDKKPVCSCLLPASRLEGKTVQTVEAHGRDNLHPVQKALMLHEGLQCGYCTPGFVNSGIAFYESWRAANGKQKPSREAIAEALAGNLCRCGAYQGIYAALQAACVGKYDEVALRDLDWPRVDALPKVTGEAKYTTDVKLEGMLTGRVLRSIHPHARIRSIDLKDARAMDGVMAIIDVLADPERTARYVGIPLVAVAAVNRQVAEAALAKVKVDYEVLPAVIDPQESQAATNATAEKSLRKYGMNSATGAVVFPGSWKGNTRSNLIGLVNNQGWRASWRLRGTNGGGNDYFLKSSFKAGAQAHTPLEPHSVIAHWQGDHLTLYGSTQGVNIWRDDLAKEHKMDPKKITVISEYVGGAFGCKAEPTPEVEFAMELAKKTGKPVKIVLDRQEVISVAGYRGASSGTVQFLSDEKRELKALKMDAYNYNGLSVGGTTSFMSGNYYNATPQVMTDYDVVTHRPFSKSFRGPGGINGAFMLETAIDQMAEKLGVDPLTLRKKWDPHAQDTQLYEYLEEVPAWQARDKVAADNQGRYRRGVGLAVGHWMYLYKPGTEVRITAGSNGFEIHTAVPDVGQGARTVVATAVADVFGLKASDPLITVRNERDGDLPTPKAGGSSVSTSVFSPTEEAAKQLQAQIVDKLTAKLSLSGRISHDSEGIRHRNGNISWPEALSHFGENELSARGKRGRDKKGAGLMSYIDVDGHGLYSGLGASSHIIVCEVEVDTLLGKVRVVRTYSAIGVGKIFVEPLARSQIAGGITMGIGYALYEDRQIDKKTGQIITQNLEDCRLPGIGDMPEMSIEFLTDGFDYVNSGGIGLGETSMIPVGAAIGNAVYHATGWRPTELPIRPEHVLEGLKG